MTLAPFISPRKLIPVGAVFTLALATVWVGNTPQAQQFPRQTICLVDQHRTISLNTEIAANEAQRRRGLKYRDHLPDNQAMLFLYPEPQTPDNAFWMHDTRVPLTIAFFTETGRIVSTHQMAPCLASDSAQCPRYEAGYPHQGAIEVRRGLLEKHNIGTGARVRWGTGPQDRPCSALRAIPMP